MDSTDLRIVCRAFLGDILFLEKPGQEWRWSGMITLRRILSGQ
jgi:hypothetical protein